MPVVLDKADIGPLLNGEAGAELLTPAAEDHLRMWSVSRRVNKTGSGDDDPISHRGGCGHRVCDLVRGRRGWVG
jgi:putative SOS response-associated peptidase YedK